MIKYKRDDRFYHVHIQQDLFGDTTIICSWGTFLSKRGGYKYIKCEAKEQINQHLKSIEKTRLKRGYNSY